MKFQQTVTISANQRISRNVYRLTFASPELAAAASPGQFIHLKPTPNAPFLLRRPFSVNDICHSKISILYRVVGKGTSHLSSLKRGEFIEVIGPLGNGFMIEKKSSIHLVVAGGIGLAPMNFLVRRLAQAKMNHLVYFGCSGKSDILPCPGRKQILTSDDGSCGRKGLVTEALLVNLDQYYKPAIYACGPWPMLKSLAQHCLERGVKCQVSLEAFMACGVGACQGCVVKGTKGYLTVCHDGPVFDAREVNWDQDIGI